MSVHGRLNILKNKSKIICGSHVTLYKDVKLSVNGTVEGLAKLEIGDEVSIGDRIEIHVGKSVKIGHRTYISWDCCILDRDYHAIQGDREKVAEVTIGNNVWIGMS